MKQYIFIIVIITICVFVFGTSYRSIIEGVTSTLPDNNQIVINDSESLRDFLGRMFYICNLDENTIKDNIKPTICYKINRLYSIFYPVKDFLDNKTEDEIMGAYGPEEETEIAGQKVSAIPKIIPIINSNHDFNVLIILVSYIKMLKPYSDLDIWVQNDSNNPPSITSSCTKTDNDSIQFVKCATEMLNRIRICLSHFQYQTDISKVIAAGDGADTGTGDVPK
jgi:hypothetical protein